MCRFQEKREWIGKCKGRFSPRIQEKLDKVKRKSLYYDAVLVGNGVWEVTDIGKCYVVDLRQRACGWVGWDMTGIPCIHACAAMIKSNMAVEDYVSQYYHVDTLRGLKRWEERGWCASW